MKRIILLIILLCFICTGCNNKKELVDELDNVEKLEEVETGYIIGSIEINDVDGKDNNYEFVYKDEIFRVLYVVDTWKIYDSYKITNSNDIKKICEALDKIHKIPSRDYKSYRIVDDMVYEWKQHNLAYKILPESNSFRNSAKDVDLDPKDQGKSLVEIYEDRTGQKLDLSRFFK